MTRDPKAQSDWLLRLETNVADMHGASIVLVTMMEDVAVAENKSTATHTLLHVTKDQLTGLIFAVYQVDRLARDLDATFFARPDRQEARPC